MGTTPNDAPIPDALDLEPIVDGVNSPIDVAFPPGTDRRYVATRRGRVLVHGPDGLRDDPLLDVSESVVVGGERGLLGIALHPDFADTRRLFVRYSSAPRAGTPRGYSHTFVLSEFAVEEGGTRADPDTERTVLEIPEPQGNHNAGDLAFGPDGYLYVPTGDGGGAADTGPGHVEDWYEDNGGGNGQDTSENLLGSILRLDVDSAPTEHPRSDDAAPAEPADGEGYAIPEDNPLVGREGHLDEHYAWGFRNPWRLSFDGSDLFVGDVGQLGWEEVDLVEAGGNYGWNVREGTHCFDASDAGDPPAECPTETPPEVRGGEPLLDPIVEYPHGRAEPDRIVGRAIIGGEVYRGDAIPDLAGRYVFGDLQPSGRLFVATPPDDGWSTALLDLTDGAADRLGRLVAFGRDPDGELYVLGGGGVHRIVPAE